MRDTFLQKTESCPILAVTFQLDYPNSMHFRMKSRIFVSCFWNLHATFDSSYCFSISFSFHYFFNAFRYFPRHNLSMHLKICSLVKLKQQAIVVKIDNIKEKRKCNYFWGKKIAVRPWYLMNVRVRFIGSERIPSVSGLWISHILSH